MQCILKSKPVSKYLILFLVKTSFGVNEETRTLFNSCNDSDNLQTTPGNLQTTPGNVPTTPDKTLSTYAMTMTDDSPAMTASTKPPETYRECEHSSQYEMQLGYQDFHKARMVMYSKQIVEYLTTCHAPFYTITSLCRGARSCDQACGSNMAFHLDSGRFPVHRVCSCDYLCLVFRDCCSDFTERCPDEEEKLRQFPLIQKLQEAQLKVSNRRVIVVTSCPDHNSSLDGLPVSSKYRVKFNDDFSEEDEAVAEIVGQGRIKMELSGTDVANRHMVTDTVHGISYLSKEVYHCNNPGQQDGSGLQAWGLGVPLKGAPSEDDLLAYFSNVTRVDTQGSSWLDKIEYVEPQDRPLRLYLNDLILQCADCNGHPIIYSMSDFDDVCQVFEPKIMRKRKRRSGHTSPTFNRTITHYDKERCSHHGYYSRTKNQQFYFGALIQFYDESVVIKSSSGFYDRYFVCEQNLSKSQCQFRRICMDDSYLDVTSNTCVKPAAILLVFSPSPLPGQGHGVDGPLLLVRHTYTALQDHQQLTFGDVQMDRQENWFRQTMSYFIYMKAPSVTKGELGTDNVYRDVVGVIIGKWKPQQPLRVNVTACFKRDAHSLHSTPYTGSPPGPHLGDVGGFIPELTENVMAAFENYFESCEHVIAETSPPNSALALSYNMSMDSVAASVGTMLILFYL